MRPLSLGFLQKSCCIFLGVMAVASFSLLPFLSSHVYAAALAAVLGSALFSAALFCGWSMLRMGQRLSQWQDVLDQKEGHKTFEPPFLKEMHPVIHSLEESLTPFWQQAVCTDLLAHMGHELRTPLHSVMGMVGLLKETALNEEQRNYVRAIEDAGDMLLVEMGHLFDAHKLSNGQLALEKSDFQLSRMVEGMVEMFAPSLRRKGVEVVTSMTGVQSWVHGDAGRLRQVLWHLMSNAVKFTHEGAVVVEVKSIEMGKGTGARWLSFRVEDTGIGMSSQEQESLFAPLPLASAGTAGRYGGTGMGLALCHQLVALMGGGLSVRSQEGKGSLFSFQIPLEAAVGVCPVNPMEQNLVLLKGAKVLVADDQAFSRKMLHRQLEQWDMNVTLVDNGATAVEEIVKASHEGQPYDIALIDHSMPGMSGQEVADYLQADPSAEGVKLVLMSAKDVSAVNYIDFKNQGFFYTLTKPIRKETLQQALCSAMLHKPESQEVVEGMQHAVAHQARIPLRVLVVDDDVISQQFACHYLRRQVGHVDVANDGIEAVTIANQIAYDVIFMDINMPHMDGVEATLALKQGAGASQGSMIVALTAHGGRDEAERYRQVGMDAVMTKPLDTEAMLELIAQVKQRKKRHSKEQTKTTKMPSSKKCVG